MYSDGERLINGIDADETVFFQHAPVDLLLYILHPNQSFYQNLFKIKKLVHSDLVKIDNICENLFNLIQ